MLIHNKDDIEFVTEFPCLLEHPVSPNITHEPFNQIASNFDWILWQNFNHTEQSWVSKLVKYKKINVKLVKCLDIHVWIFKYLGTLKIYLF